jgi:glucose dehydrogenase
MNVGGNHAEAHVRPPDQINQSNIKKLALAWSAEVDTSHGQEATPLVINGVLYTSNRISVDNAEVVCAYVADRAKQFVGAEGVKMKAAGK